MGLFDFIRNITDPGVLEEFNDLYKNHYTGMCIKYISLNPHGSVLSHDIPFETKRALVAAKDEIIAAEKAAKAYYSSPRRIGITEKDTDIARRIINRYPEAAKKMGYNSQYISESEAKEIIANEDRLDEIQTFEYGWHSMFGHSEFLDGFRHKYFVDYYPKNIPCSIKDDFNRKLIWEFKDGIYTARMKVGKMITDFLNELPIKKHLSKIVFVCAPTSSYTSYRQRFLGFTKYIVEQTGMINGSEHVCIKGEVKPKHLGGFEKVNYSIDTDFFSGKRVIIFDDLLTTGNTLMDFAEQIKSAGGDIIGAITIGKTI